MFKLSTQIYLPIPTPQRLQRKFVMVGASLFGDLLAFSSWVRFRLFGIQALDLAPRNDVAGVRYSADSLKHYRPLARTRTLLYLAAAVPEATRKPLLIIGPRYMQEYYFALSLGWAAKDVHLVDLLPSSPMIRQADMHSLPFSEQFFTIVCGYTISYSKNPGLAASEMSRCLMLGGTLIVGVEFSEKPNPPELPDVLETSKRIQSKMQFLELFPELNLSAYFDFRHLDGNVVSVLQKIAE